MLGIAGCRCAGRVGCSRCSVDDARLGRVDLERARLGQLVDGRGVVAARELALAAVARDPIGLTGGALSSPRFAGFAPGLAAPELRVMSSLELALHTLRERAVIFVGPRGPHPRGNRGRPLRAERPTPCFQGTEIGCLHRCHPGSNAGARRALQRDNSLPSTELGPHARSCPESGDPERPSVRRKGRAGRAARPSCHVLKRPRAAPPLIRAGESCGSVGVRLFFPAKEAPRTRSGPVS